MKYFALFLLFNFMSALATERLDEAVVTEYLKLQKEFSDSSCTPGSEEQFLKLDKSYRGDGNFIPVLLDEKIDLKTIKNLLPLIKDKSNWIQSQIDLIKSIKNNKELHFQIVRIKNSISVLQEARKEYFFAQDERSKQEIEKDARKQFEQLLLEVEQIKKSIPFLLSFKFPVNHLALRAEYDKYKNVNSKEARSRANSIYFFRKVVQDGTYDEDLTRNDSVIRSAFDTLYLSLTKEGVRSFLSDSERVDFHYVLANFDKFLSLKNNKLEKRFVEWKNRTDRAYEFYNDLVESKKIKLSENSQLQDITSVLEERSKSLYTLKEFVLSREAKAYEFWSKQSELMQSLYALDTILFSEVGRMDSSEALERKEVTQVVINRADNSSYNSLSEKDSIFKFIPNQIKTAENKWLNVLFKEGEFSFTYFYIPGNFHIYCPDMSRTGQFLRKENTRIAMGLLNTQKTPSNGALRYYSRLSMFGRIEMDSLWNEFKVIPESPGMPLASSKKIYEFIKKNHYKFLYDFKNSELNKKFLVVEVKGRTYVVDSADNKLIYNYRNPHLFKYFSR